MYIDFLKSINIILLEAYCCKIFLDIFLKQKYSSKWKNCLFFLILTGIFFMIGNFTNLYKMYIVRTIGTLACIFLLSMFFYKGEWQKKLFFACAFYVLLYFVDFFSFIFLNQFVDSYYWENDVTQVILILICKIMLFIFILAIGHFWNRERKLQIEGLSWILIMCIPFLSVMIMILMLLTFMGHIHTTGYIIISIGIALLNLVMLEWAKIISDRNRRWNQIRILQERNEEKIRLYQEISVDYEEQKRIMHDYFNQINCIQGLLVDKQYEELESYVGRLSETFPDNMESVDLNNPIINVVLNQKYHLAKTKGITMLFYANDLGDLWIEEQDIVSLLSNLLDNGIEACDKIGKDRDKIIHIKMIRETSQFVLSVRNTVSAPVSITDNEIPTNKKDKKRHGTGLKNIQIVLDKYNGMGMMRYENGYFYYTAVIPEIENSYSKY